MKSINHFNNNHVCLLNLQILHNQTYTDDSADPKEFRGYSSSEIMIAHCTKIEKMEHNYEIGSNWSTRPKTGNPRHLEIWNRNVC